MSHEFTSYSRFVLFLLVPLQDSIYVIMSSRHRPLFSPQGPEADFIHRLVPLGCIPSCALRKSQESGAYWFRPPPSFLSHLINPKIRFMGVCLFILLSLAFCSFLAPLHFLSLSCVSNSCLYCFISPYSSLFSSPIYSSVTSPPYHSFPYPSSPYSSFLYPSLPTSPCLSNTFLYCFIAPHSSLFSSPSYSYVTYPSYQSVTYPSPPFSTLPPLPLLFIPLTTHRPVR